MKPVRSTARVLLSGIFLASGLKALAGAGGLVPKAKRVTDPMAPVLEKIDSRLPTDPETLVQINAVVQVGGALLLALGHFTRPAATMLAASLIPTTIAGHPFWTVKDPEERQRQQVQFLKNLGLFGGLLLAAADTEGRPGVRWRAEHLASDVADRVRRGAKTAKREAKIAMLTAKDRLPG
jgi:uncharacterized membrane protein YphA (DoxX/SURF4 family)